MRICCVYYHDNAQKVGRQTSKFREDPHDPTIAAMAHFVRSRLAAEAGDAAKAATEMEALGHAYADPAVSSNNPGYNCWVAPAEEAAGHPDKADAVLKTGGTFVDCYRFRADIVDGRAPFVLFRRQDGAQIRNSLHYKGIAIRRCDTFVGLDERYLRAAVRLEWPLLVQAISEVTSNGGSR